jgi:hypothetical protein
LKTLAPGPKIAGKARNPPWTGGPSLSRKHWTKKKNIGSDKRSSLFGIIVSDEEKKFYDHDTLSNFSMACRLVSSSIQSSLARISSLKAFLLAEFKNKTIEFRFWFQLGWFSIINIIIII